MNRLLINLVLCIIVFGCTSTENSVESYAEHKEPVTNVIPRNMNYHNVEYIDNYAWLRDKSFPKIEDPMVMEQLETERTNTQEFFSGHETLINTLYSEINQRFISGSLMSWEDEKYEYIPSYEGDAEYKTWHIRNKLTGVTSVLIDERDRSSGKKHYKLQSFSISPDGKYLAFVEDTTGSGYGTGYLKDLNTGDIKPLNIERMSEYFAWGLDSNSLYFVRLDDEFRAYQVEYKQFGALDSSSEVIYMEPEPDRFVYIHDSISKDRIFIHSYTHEGNHINVLVKGRDKRSMTPISGGEHKTWSEIQYANGVYYILTSEFSDATELYSFSDASSPQSSWKKLIKTEPGSYIKDMFVFTTFIALQERQDGKDKIRMFDIKTGEEHYIAFADSAYGIMVDNSALSHYSRSFQFRYESLLTPRTYYRYDVDTRQLVMLKQFASPDFKKEDYQTEVLSVPSADGVNVPVTVIYKKSFGFNKNNPMYIYVYGAYGDGVAPDFPVVAMSAIDRGFTYVVAHVRGGDELGEFWHEDGMLMKKENSFNDFSAIVNYFVTRGLVKKGNITITGESGAGLVVGSAINRMPGMFKSAAMLVPFVDTINDLMDDTLSYTISDWSEFGNPVASKEVFDYILNYSPYDNIQMQEYPNIYATAKLNDVAVGYWGPLKWVSKIRAMRTNQDTRVIYDPKHGGHIASGKTSVQYDFAKLMTFVLLSNGIDK